MGRHAPPGALRWRKVLAAVAAMTGLVTATACGGDTSNATPAITLRVTASGCGPTPTIGTATLFDSGRAVTAAHVVAGADTISVEVPGTEPTPATVVHIDPAIDIAVLSTRIDSPTAPVLSSDGEPGDALTYTGFGQMPGESASVTIDRAATLRIDDIHRDATTTRDGWQLRGEMATGDSGAGLFDGRGRLVGMVFAVSRQPEPTAYALAGNHIRDALDTAGNTDDDPAPAIPCAT